MKLFTASDARAKASNALKKHEAEILQQILETIKAESEYSCVISEPFPFSIKIVNKLKELGYSVHISETNVGDYWGPSPTGTYAEYRISW